jgi:molybdopterin/thiamine biosynthesis adenylyltransferase
LGLRKIGLSTTTPYNDTPTTVTVVCGVATVGRHPIAPCRMDRYHRQSLLPQIGPAGQARLAAARVLLVGCGALGTSVADLLVRAGVGFLRIVDRDVVELTNLQRQVLFDEADAADGTPKAVAAAKRLRAVNSAVTVEPVVADVDAGNVESLAGLVGKDEGGRMKDEGEAETPSPDASSSSCTLHASSLPFSPVHLLLDGTDNVETRYLLNDVSAKHGVPWVYGACVGVDGRVMAVRPGVTPCLRCVFPSPPGPGELPTCDTAGVLGPAAAVVAALQATAAIQLLVGAEVPNQLVRFDLWRGRLGATPLADARRPDCPACGGAAGTTGGGAAGDGAAAGGRRYDFLDTPGGGAGGSTSLCGRNAVQVRPATVVGGGAAAGRPRVDLKALAARLAAAGEVQQTPHLLRCRLAGETGGAGGELSLTVFPDARAIVHGTSDPARARTLYARWVGA